MPCFLPIGGNEGHGIDAKTCMIITSEQQGQMGAFSCLMTRSIISELKMPVSQLK